MTVVEVTFSKFYSLHFRYLQSVKLGKLEVGLVGRIWYSSAKHMSTKQRIISNETLIFQTFAIVCLSLIWFCTSIKDDGLEIKIFSSFSVLKISHINHDYTKIV